MKYLSKIFDDFYHDRFEELDEEDFKLLKRYFESMKEMLNVFIDVTAIDAFGDTEEYFNNYIEKVDWYLKKLLTKENKKFNIFL